MVIIIMAVVCFVGGVVAGALIWRKNSVKAEAVASAVNTAIDAAVK